MKNPIRAAGNTMVVVLIWLLMVLTFGGAWLTHVVVCLQDERWGFLIAGALLFPIAVVHGFLIWLGVV